jgi:hypothetical protein
MVMDSDEKIMAGCFGAFAFLVLFGMGVIGTLLFFLGRWTGVW